MEANCLVPRLLQHRGAGLHAAAAPELEERLLRLAAGGDNLRQKKRTARTEEARVSAVQAVAGVTGCRTFS
jgi:hypothetical protein